jgi:hypothetical protein
MISSKFTELHPPALEATPAWCSDCPLDFFMEPADGFDRQALPEACLAGRNGHNTDKISFPGSSILSQSLHRQATHDKAKV